MPVVCITVEYVPDTALACVDAVMAMWDAGRDWKLVKHYNTSVLPIGSPSIRSRAISGDSGGII